MSETVELLKIPKFFADNLGIDLTSAQLLVAGVVIAISISILAFTIKKNRAVTVGIFGCEFTVLLALIALGWLPYYILIIVSVLVALLFSAAARDWITEGA